MGRIRTVYEPRATADTRPARPRGARAPIDWRTGREIVEARGASGFARAPIRSSVGGAMAGKFLKRGAIIDSVKSEHRTNAIRKREGLTRHPISAHSCGCTDPNCGAFHLIRTERTIPTTEEAIATLVRDKKARKTSARVQKVHVTRKKQKPN
jgi:hypothetical protein